MSDGNFNRALLPHTPYQSGLSAGKSMTRMHALAVLDELLPTWFPTDNAEQLQAKREAFRKELSKKL